MRVLIVGGGVAGLSTAAFLCTIPQVKHITVLEAGSVDSVSSGSYTGVWTPALLALKKLGVLEDEQPSAGDQQRKQWQAVGHSGYRTTTGQWLASPYPGLSKEIIGNAIGYVLLIYHI